MADATFDDTPRMPCLTEEQVMDYLTVRPPPLDPREVVVHLDGCTSCRLLMVEAARALGRAQREGTGTREASTLAVGERIAGRFEVVSFVARGGMGEVYEAHDTQLQEAVALKTLVLTALDDEQALVRFKAEVRLARKVTHLNVCRILEYGVHMRPGAAGRSAELIPFLTMELLRGETLAERLRRGGPMSVAATTIVARQVLDALAAIHAAGVVHRDLKSDNIVVVPQPDGGERVVVMDFGLARALDGSVVSSWPAVAMIAGTLDTMAPEQIEGRRPGPAADVFAFGALVFELLAGRRPFIDVPPLERLRSPPPQLASAAPGLPPGWNDLVARCLEIDPDRRWAGTPDLRRAFDAVARDGGSRAPAAASRWRWWLLLSLLLAVAAALALLL